MEKTMRTEKLVLPFCRKKSKLLTFEPEDVCIKINPLPDTCFVFDLCLYKKEPERKIRRYYQLASNIGIEEIDITEFAAAKIVRFSPGIKCTIEILICKTAINK